MTDRLGAALRPEDTIARIGGDEFVVLLEEVSDHEEAEGVAERIARELESPFALEGHEIFVTTSTGIVLGGPGELGGNCAEDLLRNADLTMYRGKEAGKDRYEVFDPGTSGRPFVRLGLEGDLRRAVERAGEEFVIHYQPKVELRSGRIVGFEALVRWRHPERGLVPPAEFVPLAEETGLIVPVGGWVLREACRRAKGWSEAMPEVYPPGSLKVCVNLSARQFQHESLVQDVSRALEETGLPPSSLVLEITEGIVMDDAPLTESIMRDLKALGVKLSIDDFGTGYSSLSYLRRFPADYLKIDRSFTEGLDKNSEDVVLVSATINLAKALGMRVVAEGVETEGQLVLLNSMGCNLGQGYHFAKPLPEEEATTLLAGDLRR